MSVRENEVVAIGDNVEIVIHEIGKHQVRLGVTAPKSVKFTRVGVFDPHTNKVLKRD